MKWTKELKEDEIETEISIPGNCLLSQQRIAEHVKLLFPFPNKVLSKEVLELQIYAKVKIKLRKPKRSSKS